MDRCFSFLVVSALECSFLDIRGSGTPRCGVFFVLKIFVCVFLSRWFVFSRGKACPRARLCKSSRENVSPRAKKEISRAKKEVLARRVQAFARCAMNPRAKPCTSRAQRWTLSHETRDQFTFSREKQGLSRVVGWKFRSWFWTPFWFLHLPSSKQIS